MDYTKFSVSLISAAKIPPLARGFLQLETLPFFFRVLGDFEEIPNDRFLITRRRDLSSLTIRFFFLVDQMPFPPLAWEKISIVINNSFFLLRRDGSLDLSQLEGPFWQLPCFFSLENARSQTFYSL